MIKPITNSLAPLAVIALTAQFTSAATINGSLSEFTQFFSHYDLEDINGVNSVEPNTQTTDWVLFGAKSGFAVQYTTKLENSGFSTITGATYNQPLNGVQKFKHGVGFGDDPLVNSGDYGTAADDDSTAASVSFTYTMPGAEGTMLIYLHGLNSLQDTYDFSATITGSATTPYVLTDTALPTQRVDGTGNRDGDYGIMTLNIADAQAGDVLTITFSTDYSTESSTPDGTWGVGIGAASVYAVPEPATAALLIGLLATLVIGLRRRV